MTQLFHSQRPAKYEDLTNVDRMLGTSVLTAKGCRVGVEPIGNLHILLEKLRPIQRHP